LARGVAAIARSEDGNNEVESGTATIIPQGLAEVLIGAPDFPMSGWIKKTTQPDSRVGCKTLGFLPRATPLPLETTVEEPNRVTQVMPHIADFGTNRFWRHKIIAKTCGINHSSEQAIVKHPGASVEPFDRVGHDVEIRHLPGLQIVRLVIGRGFLSLENGGMHGDECHQRESRQAQQRTF